MIQEMQHVLAAAVVMVDEDSHEILLTKRKKNQIYAGYWEFPGGKIEAGETPDECARREVAEEVGAELGAIAPLTFIYERRQKPNPEMVVIVCIFVAYVKREKVVAQEGQKMAWVKVARLDEYDLLPANKPLIPLVREWVMVR